MTFRVQVAMAPDLCTVRLSHKAKVLDKVASLHEPSSRSLAGFARLKQLFGCTVAPSHLLEKREEASPRAEKAPFPKTSWDRAIHTRLINIANISGNTRARRRVL